MLKINKDKLIFFNTEVCPKGTVFILDILTKFGYTYLYRGKGLIEVNFGPYISDEAMKDELGTWDKKFDNNSFHAFGMPQSQVQGHASYILDRVNSSERVIAVEIKE